MKLWSRGLGKTEVNMDFRFYTTLQDLHQERVYIIGSMQDPVTWEFRITLEPEDVPGLMKMFFNPAMIRLIAKNLHRYVKYLFERRKYSTPETENLEEKVNAAYEQVFYGRRPLKRLNRLEN